MEKVPTFCSNYSSTSFIDVPGILLNDTEDVDEGYFFLPIKVPISSAVLTMLRGGEGLAGQTKSAVIGTKITRSQDHGVLLSFKELSF